MTLISTDNPSIANDFENSNKINIDKKFVYQLEA